MMSTGPSQAVLAMLAQLGVCFSQAVPEVHLPNGLVFTLRPFGIEDDRAALKEAGALFAQADAFRTFCKKRGFTYDIRPIAKIANDGLWVEGLVQYERAVQLAKRIVTKVSRGDVSFEPTEELFSVLMKDEVTQRTFLSSAVPPRLIDVDASKRAAARARLIWEQKFDPAVGDPASEPRTLAEKIAVSLINYAGLWRNGDGVMGLDWAGAQTLCPAHVVWEDVADCLQAMEFEWRGVVARATTKARETQSGVIVKTEDGIDPHAHAPGVYDLPVQGGDDNV